MVASELGLKIRKDISGLPAYANSYYVFQKVFLLQRIDVLKHGEATEGHREKIFIEGILK